MFVDMKVIIHTMYFVACNWNFKVACIVFSVPGVGLTPTEAPSKDYLGKALALARKSTASIGKFTDKLHTEKPSRHTGKKRKVLIVSDAVISESLISCEVFSMK